MLHSYISILQRKLVASFVLAFLVSVIPFLGNTQNYCSPTWQYNADGNMITQVIFGDINQTSPFTSGTTPTHEDFTTQSTTVEAGSTHSISVKGPSSTFPSDVVVFIDFNQNGSFDDAGESFYIGRLASANPANALTITETITIPSGATAGATRMRVLKNTNLAAYSDPTAANSITSACGSYRSGQTEEYTINITASTTPTAPTYCTPTYTGWAVNEPAEPITLVQLGVAEGAPGAINNASVNEVSTTTPRHEDFSSIAMDVTRGESYTLLVKANTNGNNTNYITIYFDWNGDGTFSNATPANEAAQQQLTNQPEKHQHTTAIVNSNGADAQEMVHTVTIPTDAIVGPIGMRIVKNLNAPSNSPCSNPFFPRGQVEDYTLNIIEASAVHEVEVTTENNVPATITTANGTLQLIATVQPVATAPQEVTWSIESGSAVSIDQNGLVTGLTNGSATIRATSVENTSKYDEIIVTVAIPQTPANVPFTDNFEANSDWTFVNQDGRTTKWVIGNAVNNGGSQSLYVSNDDGATLSADLSILQTVHAYRDIIIPQDATIAELSFDWRSQGDFYDGGWGYSSYNYMQVHITANTYDPTGGNFVSGGTKINGNNQDGDFLNQNAWTTYSNTNFDISSYAGQTIRVIFTWRNINGSTGLPAAIDNFSLITPGTEEPEPEELTVVVTTQNNVTPEITTANGTLQLIATVTNETSSQDVIWTVQDGSTFAEVNANGLVTALANGVATIRATSVEDYNKYDEIQVTVVTAATDYCPVSVEWDVEPITLVDFADLNNPTSAEVNGTPAYEDFTSMTAHIERGATYTLTVKGNTNGTFEHDIRVFIDWNQDLEFDMQNEFYTVSLLPSTGEDEVEATIDIAVPSTAVLGNTRMRIIKDMWNVYEEGEFNACTDAYYGQVEDYTVLISQHVEVTGVLITTQNNVAPVITAENGTLQLFATVTPLEANQDVTWSVVSGNTVVTVDQNGLVTALTNGVAIVRATSVEDGTKYDEIEITVNSSSVGLELLENNISVYPNPVTDYVNISFDQQFASVTVQLIDLTGKEVSTTRYSATDLIRIDCSGLQTGAYQLIIQTTDYSVTKKIYKH